MDSLARSARRALKRYEGDRREARRSLATVHTCTRKPQFYVTIAEGGQCVKLRAKGVSQQAAPPGGQRGDIREFSRQSRTRLQQKLCSVPKSKVREGALFVTLTYPKDYPGDWAIWKKQLHAYLQQVRRSFPSASAVWKLEPQKRGAPHFHLIVFGVPHAAKESLNKAWHRIVGSSDPWHLVHGHDASVVRSHHGVVAYAAKYTSKSQALPASWDGGVGRWWGAHNEDRLGIVDFYVPLTQAEFDALKWHLDRVIWHRRGQCPYPRPPDSLNGLWLPMADTKAYKLAANRRHMLGLDTPVTLCEAAQPLREVEVADGVVSVR